MSNQPMKSLAEIVNENPFTDYYDWWPMGSLFTSFMSAAIVTEWQALSADRASASKALADVERYAAHYIEIVFKRQARADLVSSFVHLPSEATIFSGEFDALSYAFYRSSFEIIAQRVGDLTASLEQERRLFTKRVGKLFFQRVHGQLSFHLPQKLETREHFESLKKAIKKVGDFLQEQGYLRDHFDFKFEVKVDYKGSAIRQTEDDALYSLQNDNGTAYALFEMGYPAILPSAVYLYHTLGEAQHHSSRTIEELFSLIGYQASETDDFDPMGYPSDRVVELWEIVRGEAQTA